MERQLEAMAEQVLNSLTAGKLSDAVVYEFAEKCYQAIEEFTDVPWTGAIEALWNYLSGVRNVSRQGKYGEKAAFQSGQIFTALEFLKIKQERRENEESLHDDAKAYEHWRDVFALLKNGKSMTHKELSDKSGFSDSSLSQFLRKIEEKHYIQYRKVGRTKYYRLTLRGQHLLDLMPEKPPRHSGLGKKKALVKPSSQSDNYYAERGYIPIVMT